MTAACVVCTRPMPDTAYACTTCGVDRPTARLAEIQDMTAAARDVAHRVSRRSAGGSTGKPGSTLPLDLGATARLDAVQGALTTWCRHIAAERGLVPPWVTTYGDPITAASGWLSGQGEWIRHRAEVSEYLADVEECARVVRGLARGPAEQRFLGPCGAVVVVDHDREEPLFKSGRDQYQTVHGPCEGDVYAQLGGSTGRCRLCGAEVSVRERQVWLDELVRSQAFRASEIEDAYGVKANLIRQWATPARALIQVHAHDRDGRALYLLGHVLDVAADQAAKREEARAKRARRTEARDTRHVA